MLLVVAALGALVWVLARSAPSAPPPTGATTVPDDNSIPATGNNGVQSPASWGGNPLNNDGNKVRLSVSYQLAPDGQKLLSRQTPAQNFQRKRRASNQDASYLTDYNPNDRSVSPPVDVGMPGDPGQKL